MLSRVANTFSFVSLSICILHAAMAWLQRGAEAMAVRAQAKEIRATARSRLVALSSVLDWNGDGDEPILVCECKKALKQETHYSRLLHTWTCVQVASGLPKDAARN